MPDLTPCPICRESSNAEKTARSSYYVDCPRCGRFEIERKLTVDGFIPDHLRPYLSAATRQATENGQRFTIVETSLREIAELDERTTVSEKLNKLLVFLAKRTRAPGSAHVFRHSLDYPLVDARDEKEFVAYLRYLRDQRMLVALATGGGPGEAAYQLTIDGWRKLEPVT